LGISNRQKKMVSSLSTPVVVGVDIGGSHIGVGFVDERGFVLSSSEAVIQPATLDEAGIVATVAALVDGMRRDFAGPLVIVAVGIGCPGQCKDGVFVKASNLPQIHNANLATSVRARLLLSAAVPVVLLNDADAAVAAEVWGTDFLETHPGAKNVAMITIGTGVGLGLILDGKVHTGSHGLVEGGHMIVTPPGHVGARICGCGQLGCVEAYASARSTAVRLAEADAQQDVGLFAGGLGMLGLSSPEKRSAVAGGAKEVFRRASEGDKVAQAVLNDTYECLAILCINLCRVVDPDVIVLGGGMALAGDGFLSAVKDYMVRRSWSIVQDSVELVLGSDASQAGIVGAAMAARNELGHCGVSASSPRSPRSPQSRNAPPLSSSSSSSSSSRNNLSGLLVASIGLNLAVAATLLVGGGKVSDLATSLGIAPLPQGRRELAQGAVLLASQVGLMYLLLSKSSS
jgi:glucokinase